MGRNDYGRESFHVDDKTPPYAHAGSIIQRQTLGTMDLIRHASCVPSRNYCDHGMERSRM